MKQSVLPLMLVCSVVLSGCNLFKTAYEDIPPGFPETVSVIGEIDQTWSFRSLDGSPVSFDQFKGRKLFINFWATWCGPCIAELPHLQKLHDTLKSDTTVAFFFISDEDETTVNAFIAKSHYTLPFFLCDKNKPDMFGTNGYPSTFIINAGGQMVYKKVGSAKWNDPSVIAFMGKI